MLLAMFATFAGFLNDGDEVICIEPFFDQYIVCWRMTMMIIMYTCILMCSNDNNLVQHYNERW